jgi:hypothetical protein
MQPRTRQALDRLGDGPPGEGGPPGQRLVQDRPHREQIRPRIHRVVGHLFRGHVVRCAHHGAGLGQHRLVQPSDAEIGDLGLAGGGDDDVGRLDVAVDDTLAVRAAQPLQHLQQQRHHGHRCPLAQNLLQRPPLHQLHDDRRIAVALHEVVDPHDGGVAAAAGGLHLLAEALDERGSGGGIQCIGPHHLDSHHPVDQRIMRAEHRPHGAGAQQRHRLIAADAGGQRGHQRSSRLMALSRLRRMRLKEADSTAISSLPGF